MLENISSKDFCLEVFLSFLHVGRPHEVQDGNYTTRCDVNLSLWRYVKNNSMIGAIN